MASAHGTEDELEKEHRTDGGRIIDRAHYVFNNARFFQPVNDATRKKTPTRDWRPRYNRPT